MGFSLLYPLPHFSHTKGEEEGFSIMWKHYLGTAVVALAVIYVANNVDFVRKIVGPK